MKKKFIIEFVVLQFMLLFVYTAVDKLMHISSLRYVLPKYPYIGFMGKILVWALPIMELCAVTLLYFKRKTGVLLSCILMAVFTLYIGLMMIGGKSNYPCTCGGLIQELTWPQHLVLNIYLLVSGVYAYSLLRKHVTEKDRRAGEGKNISYQQVKLH